MQLHVRYPRGGALKMLFKRLQDQKGPCLTTLLPQKSTNTSINIIIRGTSFPWFPIPSHCLLYTILLILKTKLPRGRGHQATSITNLLRLCQEPPAQLGKGSLEGPQHRPRTEVVGSSLLNKGTWGVMPPARLSILKRKSLLPYAASFL